MQQALNVHFTHLRLFLVILACWHVIFPMKCWKLLILASLLDSFWSKLHKLAGSQLWRWLVSTHYHFLKHISIMCQFKLALKWRNLDTQVWECGKKSIIGEQRSWLLGNYFFVAVKVSKIVGKLRSCHHWDVSNSGISFRDDFRRFPNSMLYNWLNLSGFLKYGAWKLREVSEYDFFFFAIDFSLFWTC